MCSVYVDYDAKYLQEWGGSCLPQDSAASCSDRQHARVQARIVDTMHLVAGVYEDTANFDGDVLTFQVRGLHYMGSEAGLPQAPDAAVSGSSILRAYQVWLAQGAEAGQTVNVRESGEPTSQEVCLNHMFTHTEAGGTLGVASRASAQTNIAGGICSNTIFATNEG